MNLQKAILISLLALGMSACGGGGGTDERGDASGEVVGGGDKNTVLPPVVENPPTTMGSTDGDYVDLTSQAKAKLHENVHFLYKNALKGISVDLQKKEIKIPASKNTKYKVGDVLVSDYEGYFYAKITGVSAIFDQLTYSYAEASLADVFEELELDLDSRQLSMDMEEGLAEYLTEETTGQSTRIRNEEFKTVTQSTAVAAANIQAASQKMLKSSTAQVSNSAFTLQMKGSNVKELEFKYPQIDGELSFELNPKAKISVGLGKIYFNYEANPKISAFYTVKAYMTGKFESKEWFSKNFKTRDVKFIVYGVPFILHVEFLFKGVISGEMEASSVFTTKYDGYGHVQLKTEGMAITDSSYNFYHKDFTHPLEMSRANAYGQINAGQNTTKIEPSLTAKAILNKVAGAYVKATLPLSFKSEYSDDGIYSDKRSIAYETKLDLELEGGLDVSDDVTKFIAKAEELNTFKIFGLSLFPNLNIFPVKAFEYKNTITGQKYLGYQNNVLSISTYDSNRNDIEVVFNGESLFFESRKQLEWTSPPMRPGLHRIDVNLYPTCNGTIIDCEENYGASVRLMGSGFSGISYENNDKNIINVFRLGMSRNKYSFTGYYYVPDFTNPLDHYLNLYK